MDKNTIIGLLIIAGILIGYSLFTRPSQEELAERQRIADSTRNAQALILQEQQEQQEQTQPAEEVVSPGETVVEVEDASQDAASLDKLKDAFGVFGDAAIGDKQYITLENDLIRMSISTLGGRPYAVELKKLSNP